MALAVFVVGGVLVLRRPFKSAPHASGVKRVAVLPFENLGTPDDEYFADGIADAVRGRLVALPGLEVIARGSSTPYRKSTKTPIQVARELGVRYLLTATVRWQKGSGGANRVLVSPELVEITDSGVPTLRWQEPFDGALKDVFQVQADIASRVAGALGVALGAEGSNHQLQPSPTGNLEAYDAFLKGEKIWSTLGEHHSLGPVRDALIQYEQAVALDPAFGLAWARVSVANSELDDGINEEIKRRAHAAAEKAIALAPNAAAGYLALGDYLRAVVGDNNAALIQFGKAWRLSPGDAEAVLRIGFTEFDLGALQAGLGHLRQAERLDPRSTEAKFALAYVLLYLRRAGEAREVLDSGLAHSPAAIGLQELKVVSFLCQGDLAGSRAVIDAARGVEPTELVARLGSVWDLVWVLDKDQRELLLRLTPGAFRDSRVTWAMTLAQACEFQKDSSGVSRYAAEGAKALEEELRARSEDAQSSQAHVVYGLALAYLGRKEEAIREGRLAMKLRPLVQRPVEAPYNQHQVARIYMLVGEPEKALDELEPLLKVPYVLTPAWLKIDPNFDSLRSNPRFQKLVAGAK